MSTSALTKLALIGALGVGGVVLAASTGGMEPNVKRRAGQKVGRFLLVEPDGDEGKWRAKCERCGHEQVRSPEAFSKTSCPQCSRRGAKQPGKPFAGMRIGKFKLVREKSPHQWVVKCECGAQETRDVRNLQLSASLHSVPQCRDCKIKKLQTRKPSGAVERDILRAIEGEPKGATKIASETKMGTSTVWNALRRMKARGWVEYDAHRGATSAAPATITSAGKKHLHGSA